MRAALLDPAVQEQLLRDLICPPLAAQHHQLAFAVTFLTPSAPL